MKKHETTSTVLLKHHLKALKLPTMTAECEKVAARCAKENVDHLGFLLQLSELELLDRERRAAARRLKAARFPTPKSLDEFDFTATPAVNKPLVLGVYRWVVERTISWLHGFRKLRLRTDRAASTHEALVALATSLICMWFL